MIVGGHAFYEDHAEASELRERRQFCLRKLGRFFAAELG
jgi:hypothetical protein